MKTLFVIVVLTTILRVQAKMNWTVYKKITGFNQTLTLYCQLEENCKKTAGWVKWVSNSNFETLIFSVKEKSFDEDSKYDGRIGESGFYLMIRHVSSKDFGVNYSCTYGIDISPQKILASADVFIDSDEPTVNKSIAAKTIVKCDHPVLYPVVIGFVLVVTLLSVCLYRAKQENGRLNIVNENLVREPNNLNEVVPSPEDSTNAEEIVSLLETHNSPDVGSDHKWKDDSTAEGNSICYDTTNHFSQNKLLISGSHYPLPKQLHSMSSPNSCNSDGHVTSYEGTRELRHDDSQQAANKSHEQVGSVYHNTSLKTPEMVANASFNCGTHDDKYRHDNTEPKTVGASTHGV